MEGQQEHIKWEEEEEEEQEVGQLVKQPKSRNNNAMATDLHAPMSPISSTSSSDKGAESGSPNGEERKEPDNNYNNHIAGQEDHDTSSVANSAGSPGSQQDREFTELPNSVFFDKNQGTDLSTGVPGKEFGGVELRDDQNLDVKVVKFGFQSDLAIGVSHQIAENSVDEIESFFGLNPSTLEESCEEQNGGLHFDSKSRVEADVDVIKEIDQEGTQIDLERVLEKQDTHDLYCPNCNSCITRRVILRRRKRKIHNLLNKQKREKPKTIVPDNNDTVNNCSNGSPTLAAGDRDSETEPDIFRCLSCFSFFIPTGNGFKLFQVPKDGNENENMLNSQKIAGPKTNWFFSIFASDKRETPTEQGDDVIVIVEETNNQIRVDEQQGDEASEGYGLDILKSIVYGGLIESITSVGVVSSAAGAGATTLNIFGMGLANLIGGLIIIGHNLADLKNDRPTSTATDEEPLLPSQATNQLNEREDRYQDLLGRRGKFPLHAAVAVLSFLIFGLVSPVIYGFSFRESDNRDFKLAAVAGASLVCIVLLAVGKSYVRKPPKSYIKTVSYYVSAGFMASGVSFIVGELVSKLLGKLGWFDSSSAFTLTFQETKSTESGWATY